VDLAGAVDAGGVAADLAADADAMAAGTAAAAVAVVDAAAMGADDKRSAKAQA
jgi:hypothetical protein